MKWIGLTGGLASGKSTVARLLRQKGFPVIDADEIAHQVVMPGSPGYLQVIQTFGQDLVQPDGSLDRRKLGQRVFGNPEMLARLEGILHPLIQQETLKQRKKYEDDGQSMAFYDVPLLFEKKMGGFDRIVLVTTDPQLQRERAMKRDGLTPEEISRRLASQIPLSEKEKLADEVIRNDLDLKSLEGQVDTLVGRLTS